MTETELIREMALERQRLRLLGFVDEAIRMGTVDAAVWDAARTRIEAHAEQAMCEVLAVLGVEKPAAKGASA